MNNLWRAFIRKLPKRVLFNDGVYYPQVWFIWWHSVWGNGLEYEIYCFSLEKAKRFIEHNWDPITKPKKEVVWKSK